MVVMMAVPHDMLGGGTVAFAVRVITTFIVNYASFIEPVGSTYAAGDDGL